MKRLLSTILAIVLLLSCTPVIPLQVLAETGDTCEEYLTWEVSDDQVFIEDCDESISGDIIIPATLDGYPVISISSNAFDNCTGITGVTIPNGIRSLSKGAFYGCENLENVVLPDSVVIIGDYAFQNCTSLKSITIPENVSYIGMQAFSGCSSLTDVIIKGVDYITPDAFNNCSSLTGIWVDENNLYYCSDAQGVLYNKDKTTLIHAPGGITGAYTIPDSVTIIEWNAFDHCSSLTSVVIPDSVTSIGNGAFLGCTALTDVYYSGTRKQWDAVAADNGDGGNDALLNAAIHCKETVEYCYIQNGEEITVGYDTMEAALAAANGGTVKLLADAQTDTVALKPGVTLDLNGHTLEAELLVAMNGAVVLGDGLLKIARDNLVLAEDNSNVIPVWNGMDGYIFTKVTCQQMAQTTGEGTAQYIFLPSFSNAEAAALLADGGADNGLKLKVNLTWNNGLSQQFYTYDDAFVAQVFESAGGLAFSLTVTGIAGIADMTASAVITTDSAAQAAATGTPLTAG